MVSAGYADSGDEASLTGGFGNEHFSVGVARHTSDDNQSANGTPLNNSFERDSASLQYRAQIGDYAFDALLLPSRTDDIGKSNSRYPTRDTTYPEDDHTLARLRLRQALLDSDTERAGIAHDLDDMERIVGQCLQFLRSEEADRAPVPLPIAALLRDGVARQLEQGRHRPADDEDQQRGDDPQGPHLWVRAQW